MSLSLTQVQQVEYDMLVKYLYQSRGFLLRDTFRQYNNVIGSSVQFRTVGSVVAVPTGYQAVVQGQDPGYAPHVATLQKYTAPIYVDTVQELTVNFDARRESAMLVAMAIGRRSDQISIAALASDPGDTIVNGGTNMTYEKLRECVKFFESNAVPENERFLAMSGNNLAALLDDDHITSRLFTSNETVPSGTLSRKQIMGMNVIIIPNIREGGLPLSGNIRSCFAWHYQALGMGIGMDMRTEINYVPKQTSWLVNGIFFAGATPIDNLGILQIDCDESVTP